MSEPVASPTHLTGHRSFVLFWCARTFTNGAFLTQGVAVGWQIYELTNNPLDLGHRHRSLRQRDTDLVGELAWIERLAATVALHDDQLAHLDVFIGRETPRAGGALTPPAN